MEHSMEPSQAPSTALGHAPIPESSQTDMLPDRQSDVDTHAAMLRAAALPPGPEQQHLISAHTRRPGGLRSDQLRQIAWPILLGCPRAETQPGSGESSPIQHPANSADSSWRKLPEHRDEDQVRLDVNRSFIYYPHNQSESQIQDLKIDLQEVITATLRRHPKLCYFQGFHDIVQLLLLVLGKKCALEAVPRLSLLRLRDFMLPSLSSSLTQLELLPAILRAADATLAQHLSQTRPFFALAATLTMFAHDIESYAEIARLFDFLLAEDAVVAIYLYVSIILSRRQELLDIPADDQEMLFFTLQKLPKTLDFESLIQNCISLARSHPPESLPQRAWAKISPYSVLRTTRSGAFRSLAEASRYFDAQLTEAAWQQRRERALHALWAYRRPAAGVGAAVLVALLSYWLQRGPDKAILTMAANKVSMFAKMLLGLAND